MNNNFLFNFYKTASDFRLYLRHKFYPNNLSYIQDIMMNCVTGIVDIDCSDSFEYKLKCRKNKNDNNGEYCLEIENVLASMLIQSNFKNYILRDSDLSSSQKESFFNTYNDIYINIHMSPYIKMLYDISILPINTLSRLVLVNL